MFTGVVCSSIKQLYLLTRAGDQEAEGYDCTGDWFAVHSDGYKTIVEVQSRYLNICAAV